MIRLEVKGLNEALQEELAAIRTENREVLTKAQAGKIQR